MTFSPEQTKQLSADLDRKHVKSRQQGNSNVSYIEGWHALAEANRIFGFSGWSAETVSTTAVAEGPRKIGRPPQKQGDRPQRDGFGVTYTARVRITVYAGERAIIREGVGAGHGIDVDLGIAHESALKEAATDATKRALISFGNPFGLALYDKAQRNVSDDVDTSPLQSEPAGRELPGKFIETGEFVRADDPRSLNADAAVVTVAVAKTFPNAKPVSRPPPPVIPTVAPPAAPLKDLAGKRTSGQVRQQAAKQEDWREREKKTQSKAVADKLLRGPLPDGSKPLSMIEADIPELGGIRAKHALHRWEAWAKAQWGLLLKDDRIRVKDAQIALEKAIDRAISPERDGADADTGEVSSDAA